MHLNNTHFAFSSGLSIDFTRQKLRNSPQYINESPIGSNPSPPFFKMELYKNNISKTSLSVPLSFSYSIGDTIKFYTKVGGFVNFFTERFSSEYHYTNPDQMENFIGYEYASGLVKQDTYFDYGIVGGLGIIIPFEKSNSLIVQLDFKYGLNKITIIGYEQYIRLGIGFCIGKDENQLNLWCNEVLKD